MGSPDVRRRLVWFVTVCALVGGCGGGADIADVATTTTGPPSVATSSAPPAATVTTQPPALPTGDLEVTGTEYAYSFVSPVAPGPRTLRFRNGGTEYHELIFGRMVDGATASSVVASPTFTALVPDAQTTSADPQQSAQIPVDLQPGSYILVCYTQTEAGERHVDLGMVATLVVGAASTGA